MVDQLVPDVTVGRMVIHEDEGYTVVQTPSDHDLCISGDRNRAT